MANNATHADRTTLTGFAASSSGGPRDKSFKLIEITFLQVMPVARSLRETIFFTSIGFEGATEVALRGVYARNHVSGFSLPSGSSGLDTPEAFSAHLDAASGIKAAARFDCLSVLGCAPSRRVLDMVCRGDLRPALIHCADTASFDDWLVLRDRLVAKSYLFVGEMDGAHLYLDGPLFDSANAVDERPVLASFDVFDTLIARRCLEPWRVFQTVGEISGIADFLDQRRAAEARVLGGNYRFDDIYDELARHYGWSADKRMEIQALEMRCELETVIPIKENLARVRDGDLLVSDMYLEENQIRSLVAKAGLKAQVGLFVASHAKSSGRIWPIIDKQFKITRHLGDNAHADVAMPRQFGLETEHTRSTDLNVVEQTFMQAGLRELALLCREARLSSWHPLPTIRSLQIVQTSINFPLLLLSSVALARRAKALGSTSLLFCSRDCNVWLPLFDALQKKMGMTFDTRYFLTSRLSRKKGSDAYLDYARERMLPGALVVDLCGTGWTMANLAARLGLTSCNIFLIDHCPPLDIYERVQKTPDTCKIHPLFAQRPNVNNIVLELANMAEHGMVVDMRKVEQTLVPVFAPNPMSAIEMQAIQEQRACFLAAVSMMDRYDLQSVFALDDASLSFLCSSLYEYMSKQTDSFQIFAQNFLNENMGIVKALTT